MNGKQSKKIRQLYMRDVRKMVEAELRVLNKIVRPRPKRMPTWLWLLLMRVFFHESYIKKQKQAIQDLKILTKDDAYEDNR